MNDSTICPHCHEPLPPILDAFCTYCRERIDEPPGNDIDVESSSLLPPRDMSELTAELRIDSEIELPTICVLCGKDGERFQNFRIHRKHEVRKFLVLNLAGNIIRNLGMGKIVGRTIGNLLADEAFDERPLDLRLPICFDHEMQDLSMVLDAKLVGGKSRARSAIVGKLHPSFVEAAKHFISKRWESLGD